MSPGKQNVCLSSNIDRVIIKYYMEVAVNNLVWQCPVLIVHTLLQEKNKVN